jgi:cyclopropane fatty-acyl-phospholipid synthase-like methyltransferase
MVSSSHPRPPVDPTLLNAGTVDAMWTNLGIWSTTREYPTAARALAELVGVAAGLGAADTVVDYACGYGDSLRLWVERFGVRRAIGVEPDPTVCDIVRRRIAGWGLADRLNIVTARAEACAPRQAAPDVTAVVCIDAAYHFRSRLTWWQLLVRDLPPGTRIACSDLVLADGRRASTALRGVAAAMRIPDVNLVDAAALCAGLHALSLRDVSTASLGAAVLDGFVAYAPRRGCALRVTSAGIGLLRRSGWVDYLLLAGTVGNA